jgi:hypothetical protein
MRIFADYLAAGIWTYSAASLTGFFNPDEVNVWLKILATALGLLYFALIKIPHELKMNKEKRKKEELENIILQNEINDYFSEDKNEN